MRVRKGIPGQRCKRESALGTGKRSGVTEYRGIWLSAGQRGWKGGFDKIPVSSMGHGKVFVLNNTFHLKGSMVSFGFGDGNSEVYGEK